MKLTRFKWRHVALASTLAAIAFNASAGIVKVKADPGTDVTIKYHKQGVKKDGKAADLSSTATAGKDGIAEFSFGALKEEAKLYDVFVVKTSNNAKLDPYEIKINTETGVTIAALEPIKIPNFASISGAPIAYTFDANLLASSSVVDGAQFQVVSGITSAYPAAYFYDASTLTNTENLLATGFTALPAFEGGIKVTGFDSYQPVPEPSAWALGVGGLVIAAASRRKRAVANQR